MAEAWGSGKYVALYCNHPAGKDPSSADEPTADADEPMADADDILRKRGAVGSGQEAGGSSGQWAVRIGIVIAQGKSSGDSSIG